jgi:AAA+ ATPase superfamily predicted ATPase
MGLARREIPFGESERKSKRSLYRIDDPFFRLWFRVVAPHRGQLVTASKAGRRRLLERHFDTLNAQAWEDLCRIHLTGLRTSGSIGKLGPWRPGSRWWKANLPEWDVVALSMDDRRLLLGDVNWSRRRFDKASPERVVRALFVPALAARVPRRISGVEIVTGDNMLR